jgi:hypothetical protein
MKEKEIEALHMNFGPFLMKTKCPDNVIKALLDEGAKAKDLFNDNLAGHLNHQYVYPKDVSQQIFGMMYHIFDYYRKGLNNFHRQKQTQANLVLDDLWINYMEPGDFNPPHHHSQDYSFVIFCDVPKELKEEAMNFQGTGAAPGSIVFHYGEQGNKDWATVATSVVPEIGDMYVFPSNMQHWVCPFKSKVRRISVSGNIIMINKNYLPKHYVK